MLPDIQPGNTKILYFFNCLLDGMHTKIKHICGFRRGVLNAHLYARIQHLLPGHKYALFISLSSAHCLYPLSIYFAIISTFIDL